MVNPPRRRKQRTEQPTTYALNISRWEWSYSFGLNPIRRESDPFMEFRHLTVHGLLVGPRHLKDKKVQIVVIPDQHLHPSVRSERISQPLAVGSLGRIRGTEALDGSLSLPSDILDTLTSMLAAERLQFVLLHGTRLGRGGARIRSYRFSEAVTEDDLYEP